YGSGKSAFVLFLASVLGLPDQRTVRTARAHLKGRDSSLYETLFGGKGVLRRPGGLLPVLATADRRPLSDILLAALHRSSSDFWGGRGVKPAVVHTLNKLT